MSIIEAVATVETPIPTSLAPAPKRAPIVDPLAETARLAGSFRERAMDGERLRTMPADLVAKVRAARLFTLALPRSLGGLELDPLTIVDIIEQLTYADGSAGWTTMIGNSTSFLAWFDPSVAAAVVADGVPTMASVFAPKGTAVTVDPGAFDVNGRWCFASGSPHAEWFINGVIVMDGPAPRMHAGGQPDWCFALLPAADTEIVDTWDALGLRGSGSHDVQTTSPIRVPEDHLAMPFNSPARHDGPLYRFPFWGLLGVLMSGVSLGIAQRALDELVALAPQKHRPPNPAVSVAGDPHLQIEMARAETRVRGAKAYLVDSIGCAWDTACNGDVPSNGQLAAMQMAMLDGLDSGIAAVDLALRAGGASSVYSHQPIQRCFRDLHTVAQHAAFNIQGAANYGRSRFGLDQQTV